MKIPTDEEIKALSEKEGDGHDCIASISSALTKMRDQLKPILDLVEQLRESRKLIESEKKKKLTDARCMCLKIEIERLDQLRDKLELGE